MDRIEESSEFQRLPISSPEDHSEFTFHSAEPSIVIDWIIASNHWELTDYQVIPSLLSDHRPVVAEVRLESGDSP